MMVGARSGVCVWSGPAGHPAQLTSVRREAFQSVCALHSVFTFLESVLSVKPLTPAGTVPCCARQKPYCYRIEVDNGASNMQLNIDHVILCDPAGDLYLTT